MATSLQTYLDFWIRIDARVEKGYKVSVLQSPAGGGSDTVALDADALTAASVVPLQGHVRHAVMRDISDDTPVAELQDMGRTLFDGLFTGTVRSLFDTSLGMAQAKGVGLRIKLQIAPDDPALTALNALPWEMLYVHATREYLSLSDTTPVVRFLDVQRPYERQPFSNPLRVLVVMANPSGSVTLNLQKERAAIESSWAKLPNVDVRIIEHTTRAALLTALTEHASHVLHFMGHGGFDDDSGDGVLLFETASGDKDPMTGTALGVALRDMPSMRLVFLNACDTARLTTQQTQDPFAGVASALVMAGIPAVIAMQYPVTDEAAVAFSHGFYSALAAQRPVDAAVGAGRQAVHDVRPESLEWATPVLFMRAPDGYLFTPAAPPRTTAPSRALMIGALAVLAIAAMGVFMASSKPVTLTPAEVRTEFPRSVQLTALSNGARITPDRWTSSDTSIAIVNDGRIQTRRAGSATITASVGWFSKGSTTITVVPPKPVVVRLAQRQASIAVGDTVRIPARALTADDVAVEPTQLAWTSADSAIARVMTDGTIVARAAGRTTVVVSSAAGLSDTLQLAVIAAGAVPLSVPTSGDAAAVVATADTSAPVLVRLALSPKSTFVRTTTSFGATYYSATARYAVRSGDTDDDAWYSRCDVMLADPAVQTTALTYFADGSLGAPVPRSEAVAMLARPGFSATYRARLREQFLTAPGRTEAAGQIDEIRRGTFVSEVDAAERAQLTALVKACTPPQPKDALVLSVAVKNPSTAHMTITDVRYQVLDDRGEAGGGAGAGTLEPVATYLHRLRRKCGGRGPEVFPFALTPLLEVDPGRTVVFDLQPTIRGYDGAFLAPLQLRVEIVTDRGTVRSRPFWVEGPSCAG